ncbi:MAG: hypothetical protein BM556_17785 [Bacteriovorax sp. MedPE-SWde]|nr:MAG: hypothetical protein BM556_17785 [Bacteriovorax sp. MedPE-SWde]
MKKTLLLFILSLTFTSQAMASSCRMIKVLNNKLEESRAQYRELEEAVFLSEKLQEANSWGEWSTITESEEGGRSILTAKEVDILLLLDLLNDSKDGIYKEMGYKAGVLGTTVAFNFVGARIINKLLAHGYKAGFMKKIQKLIIDDVDNTKKAQKIKHLATVLMLAAPAYIGYKEYQLYQLLQEAKRKIEVIEDVAADLPELAILEERIISDQLRIEEIESRLDVSCE